MKVKRYNEYRIDESADGGSVARATAYARSCHEGTNHLYDGKPYAHHLEMVSAAAHRFIHLVPEGERDAVLEGCWVHDCIEDCRQTYNDVLRATSPGAAEIAYALTNEKGRTRRERANAKYYEGIRVTPGATFVKLCDRIANATYSRDVGSRMLEMYRKENTEFEAKLRDERYTEMFEHLSGILK